jgi:hypothetical protein
MGMHKSYCFEQLFGEGLHVAEGEAPMTILLDDIVEGRAEGLEHHAVILMMIEGLHELDDAAFVICIRLVEGLHYGSFRLGRVHVLLHWLNNLHNALITFTANSSSLYRASKTRPKVPVPSCRVTLYLCPSFSPILCLKWGVVLRLCVEEETELLELLELEWLEEDEELCSLLLRW